MTSSGKIRILLVDDHFIFRMGLTASVQKDADLKVIAEASTGEQAIKEYRQHRPAVTLMDLHLPDMDGTEATAAICREFPEARVIILTTYRGDENIHRALQAGAKAYLLKTVLRDELLRTIRAVHQGESYLPPDIAAELAQRMSRPDLTTREHAVLTKIVQGRSNKEIAKDLFISEATVKEHVSNLFTKLHVADRTQAATAAIQRGIIRLA
jgi:two-component system NarL family response regulator